MNGKNKGGRPKKTITRNQSVHVSCTLWERKIIQLKAEKMRLTVSEFLRYLGMGTPIDIKQKTLPKEVLLLAGTLNHAAANLNQFTKLNNQGHNFNAMERAECKVLINTIEKVVTEIRKYLAH